MCNKNRAKEYYKNNKDVILNRSKEYYINNKESILEHFKNKYQSWSRELFEYPQKYLYVVSLSFHLLETTILLKSTESNKIASLDE